METIELPTSRCSRRLTAVARTVTLGNEQPNAIRDCPRVSSYAFEEKICDRTESIRDFNIVSWFIAPMPILRPQILQLYDGYVSIDVTEIDGTLVSGDTKPVHTGYRAVIAIK